MTQCQVNSFTSPGVIKDHFVVGCQAEKIIQWKILLKNAKLFNPLFDSDVPQAKNYPDQFLNKMIEIRFHLAQRFFQFTDKGQ